MVIFFLGLATVVVPLVVLDWLIYSGYSSKWGWLVKVLAAGGATLFFYMAAPWGLTSYYMRFVMLGLFFVAAVYAYRRTRGLRWVVVRKRRGRQLLLTVFLAAFVALNIWAFLGKSYTGTPVALSFPLQGGSYYVLQGGSNGLTNPFHELGPHGRLSLDIVKLNQYGNRANSLMPSRLGQYHIYGEALYSPCSGTVRTAMTGLPDNAPDYVDKSNPLGNHVVIVCQGVEVTLAHMMQDSVLVKKGNRVAEGRPIGKVGNSGFSNEPHLHIQANKADGQPTPMRFGRRFLSINDLVVSGGQSG